MLYSMTEVCRERTDSSFKVEDEYSVALVRKQTISTERPPIAREVSANFWGYRVSRGQRNGSPRLLISIF
jgi:hypothetical protein